MPEESKGQLTLSAATIKLRCAQVASSPHEYDFPGRLSTCEQYRSLVGLFSRLNFERDEDLLAGSLAAYGWMPTMMDGLTCRNELKLLLAEVRLGNAGDVPALLEMHRQTGVLKAVNNSIVGTSKLLHFFLPDKIPIWDSVLGRSFGLNHRHQFHREDRFIAYVQAVHEAAQSGYILWDRLDIATANSAEDVSKVRKIEFALYAFSRRHGDTNDVPSERDHA